MFVPRQCNYELRRNNLLERRRVKSVRSGTKLAPKIWETLPNGIKDSDTLQIFQAKIKKWVPVECRIPLYTYTMQNLSASSRIYLGSRNHIYIYIYIYMVFSTEGFLEGSSYRRLA